jgi:hypothetical protein
MIINMQATQRASAEERSNESFSIPVFPGVLWVFLSTRVWVFHIVCGYAEERGASG